MALSAPVSAHEDTALKLLADGSIIGLPDEYEGAGLHIERNQEGRTSSVELNLAGHSYSFPECLQSLFNLPEGEQLQLSASWYHPPGRLPPYINISLPQKTYRPGWFTGHSILFNLSNAELIYVYEKVVSVGDVESFVGSTMSHQPGYVALCGGEEPSVSSDEKDA